MRGCVVMLGLFTYAGAASSQQVFRTETGFGSNQKSIVDFTTILSSNGRYEMSIDPTERFGAGSATYRLKCDGQEVWTKEFAFTLRFAFVTDDGVTCGYAYTEGPFPRALGQLQIALIDARGDLRVAHSWERQHSRFFHVPPTPQAYGVSCEAALDRFSVLVHSTSEDPITEWWTFRLSDGERITQVDPPLEVPEFDRLPGLAPKEPLPALDEIELESLGTRVLERSEPTRSWFRELRAWDFASDGSFLTLDEISEGCLVFRRLSPSGEILAERAIDGLVPAIVRYEGFARISDREWYVAVREHATDSIVARRLDVDTGTWNAPVDAIPLGRELNSMCATPEGGLAVVVRRSESTAGVERIVAFDAAGIVKFIARDEAWDDFVRDPEALGVMPSGEIAVLTGGSRYLTILRSNGDPIDRFDLGEDFKRKSFTPRCEREGEVWLVPKYGSRGSCVSLDTPSAVTTLPISSGIRIPPRAYAWLRVRADGEIWTTDGWAFYQLDRSGQVDRVLGAPPDEEHLDEVGAVEIDALGRSLVLDARSGCLHVFGTDGEQAFVARPERGEEFRADWFGGLKAESAGGLCASLASEVQNDFMMPFYARFDSTGKRVATVRCVGPLVGATSDGGHWQGGSFFDGPLAWIDERGEIVRTVERTPDGRWLRRVCGGALDPNGNLVAITEDALVFVGSGEDVESFPQRRAWGISVHCAATNEWVLLPDWRNDAVTLFSRREHRFLRWTNPGAGSSERWTYGFSADGTELLALESPALVIHRFKLP